MWNPEGFLFQIDRNLTGHMSQGSGASEQGQVLFAPLCHSSAFLRGFQNSRRPVVCLCPVTWVCHQEGTRCYLLNKGIGTQWSITHVGPQACVDWQSLLSNELSISHQHLYLEHTALGQSFFAHMCRTQMTNHRQQCQLHSKREPRPLIRCFSGQRSLLLSLTI